MRQTWTGCILLSTALGCSAATLGRHSGAAIIGQPLDVRVQVLLAPGEDLANLCLTADVFYGDSQVSSGAVRSVPQKTAPDAETSLRIQAAAAVNEPIVTLYVKAGCGTPFTRRFVLLADPLNEPAASTAAPARAMPSPAPPVQAPGTGAVAGGSEGAATPRSNPRPAASAPGGVASVRGAPAAGTAAASTTRAPGAPPPSVVRRVAPAAPRLTLDPLDLEPRIERDPLLKLSPLLLSEPAASEEARAAAGLLWKTINAAPEDVLRDAQRLAALEAEAGQLRTAQGQSANDIQALNSQLTQARDERYRNWLVYLLGGLLLLALLALLALSRRRPVAAEQGPLASRAWWSADPADKPVTDAAPRAVRLPPHGKSPAMRPTGPATPDVDLNLGQDSAFDGLRPQAGEVDRGDGLPAPDRRDFSHSALGSRSVAAEELFDVQQQADFFVSLGENEQAIQVLRNHLAESHEPSPLAYLDLFKLYHRLGRRSDYDALRDEFNHVFNAGAPPFAQYEDAGRGLEAYETAFSRIQSLWPQPRVLDLIEESIFRDAQDDAVEVFDLEAYRELLLLHAIAKDLVQRDDLPGATASAFGNTRMQPLTAEGRALGARAQAHGDDLSGARNTEPMGLDLHFPASSSIGLDIDLDELFEYPAFESSLPEVSPPVTPTSARKPDRSGASPSNMIDFDELDFSPPAHPDAKPDGER